MSTTAVPKAVEETVSQQAEPQPQSIIISDGAALALGNALSRFITVNNSNSGTKRPRPINERKIKKKPLVLAENEEVKKELVDREESKRKYKLQRQRKLKFESNARVIPDVTTNFQMEKMLLETATNGAVLFFNTVSKTQKANRKLKNQKNKKKLDKDKKVITKQSFMNLMKAGIQKSTAKALPMNIDIVNVDKSTTSGKSGSTEASDDTENSDKEDKVMEDDTSDEEGDIDDDGEGDDNSEENSDVENETERPISNATAKWIKDDYLTSGSGGIMKSKDWEEKSTKEIEGSSEESDEEEMEMDDEESDDESEYESD